MAVFLSLDAASQRRGKRRVVRCMYSSCAVTEESFASALIALPSLEQSSQGLGPIDLRV